MTKAVKNDLAVRAAETTLRVLETVAFSEEELGVTQIAARLGLTKGAVFRHLHGLVERGYLLQNPTTSHYRLGVKAYLIGRLAPRANDLAGSAEGPMRKLSEQTGITTVLTTPTAHGCLVLNTILASRTIEIGVRPGSELSFHAAAQGKIILAFGPGPLLDRALKGRLPSLTPHTITDAGKLRTEIAKVREQGYAIAPEESLLGIAALAAPVFNMRDELVAAVALVGSIQYIPRKPSRSMIDGVKRMAQDISRNLGYGLASWQERARRIT
ncbi:MAG TPA: IclR family transcriptional regulator [Pseudolabrys sp.]|jgi:DNA-binding IclR family transcriptional regulator|nr:IclR family transcriptional regulator [Pseudolabrys sp.]